MATLRFLGTGNAFNTDGRASQALWLEAQGRSPFLVDIGPTALHAIRRQGLDPDRLDACFITHLHGDHIAGWPFLLLQYVFPQRERPFRLVGPSGTPHALNTLAATCYSQVARENLPFPLEESEFPIAAARGLTAAGQTFDVIPMDHARTSVGYRFSLDGHTIAISGDTQWCTGLEDLARGSDTLVLECTTVTPTPAKHVSLEDLRGGVERLDAARIVLVHLEDRVAQALDADPIPRVQAAHDGMVLEL